MFMREKKMHGNHTARALLKRMSPEQAEAVQHFWQRTECHPPCGRISEAEEVELHFVVAHAAVEAFGASRTQ